MADVIRIKPFHYIHVLDNNTNVTRVVVGPKTFTRQDHEQVVTSPTPMIMIPPRHYCIIKNPAKFDEKGKPMEDEFHQVIISHGDEVVRTHCKPFPLYPGEQLYGKVSPLMVVAPLTALKLRCIRDFDDKKAGDEWLFEGLNTYQPKVEVQVVDIVRAIIIKPNQALKLRATQAFYDEKAGAERYSGEEWLVRTEGAYMPSVYEQVVETISATILTEKKALHLMATCDLIDSFEKKRLAGEHWLVTNKDCTSYIPGVQEKVVGEINLTVLNNRQYCVVCNYVENGKNRLGMRQLRKGECSFFLQPGESLENGIQSVHILDAESALLLRAREAWQDKKPGERWMIYGPCEYVPPVEVEIIEKRRSIPLDVNEGVYVRDIQTGHVRSQSGSSYMLKAYEQLWEKQLPQVVEDLLCSEVTRDSSRVIAKDKARDKSKVVCFHAPHNSAVQVYDYRTNKSRVEFGPLLVSLEPDEEFTVLSLSGDKPKRPDVIKSLAAFLGPDFMTDVVIVETADHARLSLKLSYNWYFRVNKSDKASAAKIFNVPDFVGDACKAIASRVRGAVAAQPFDTFHKNSASIIRLAVFGKDKTGEPKKELVFENNNMIITNIDIQSVEPVDQRTRDALQKSVQLAIEITTKAQEANALHEAERREQVARGALERQRIRDEATAEIARTQLLQLQSQSTSLELTGRSTAEAQAQADAAKIDAQSAEAVAQLHANAQDIVNSSELEMLQERVENDLAHKQAMKELEVHRAEELAKIEADKFKVIVNTIGKNTIKAMAQAGPEMSATLLKSLGLQGFMITDGNSPINLFDTASKLIGQGQPQPMNDDDGDN